MNTEGAGAVVRTVGVEEELLLVDPESGEARALSTAVLALAEKDAEGSRPSSRSCTVSSWSSRRIPAAR